MQARRTARAIAVVLSLASAWGSARAVAQSQAPPPDGSESMTQATTQESDMDDTRARAAFRLGRQYYEQGRFHDAAVEFERAYGLSGRGELLFNAYLAYREAGNTESALRALQGYLSQVPDAPDREHLQARLEYLRQQVAAEQEREARARAEAEAARLAAEDARRQLEFERNRPRTARPWWPWLIVGGGVAAVGVGIALGVVAAEDAARLREDCNGMGLCNPAASLGPRRSSIQGLAAAADVLWIGGTVIGVAGLLLVFALPDDVLPPPRETARLRLTPAAACWNEGCIVSLGLAF